MLNFRFKILTLLLLLFFSQNNSLADNYNVSSNSLGNYFKNFIENIKKDFENLNNTPASKIEKNIYEDDESPTVQNTFQTNSKNIDFFQIVHEKYLAFAIERYNAEDYVDAFFFKQKALRIKKYKQISPINPVYFGVIPEDIDQFFEARDALKNISIEAMMDQNDIKILLADTYLAYDCWLESLEESYAKERMKICKDRFFENIRALEMIAFKKNIKVRRYKGLLSNFCKSCDLAEEQNYCNTFYFKDNSIEFADGLSIILRKLELKLLSSENPTVLIGYYQKGDLTEERIKIIYNLLQSRIFINTYNKPIVKMARFMINKKDLYLPKYQNTVTVCIKENN